MRFRLSGYPQLRGLLVVPVMILLGCAADSGDGMPRAPSALTVSEMDRAAHVTWRDNSIDEVAFVIERAEGEGPFLEIARETFNTVQLHDDTVTSGTEYRYRVAAENDVGMSDYSDEARFRLP